jgi:hypothetical protein
MARTATEWYDYLCSFRVEGEEPLATALRLGIKAKQGDGRMHCRFPFKDKTKDVVFLPRPRPLLRELKDAATGDIEAIHRMVVLHMCDEFQYNPHGKKGSELIPYQLASLESGKRLSEAYPHLPQGETLKDVPKW